MRITGILLLLICLLGACVEIQDYKGKIPLVEVSGEILYKEDLATIIPPHLTGEDSALFANNYIRNWIEDVLLYDLAELNIPDNERITRLTENYRKSLVMHTYQQALIDQKLSSDLTEQEMHNYYEKNKEAFTIEYPLLKGLFIKVPKSSNGLNNVRKWYKTNTEENVEALEKFSLDNAVSYNYFYDRWVPATDIMEKIPIEVGNMHLYLQKNKHIEVSDDEYVYFLNVDKLLPKGSIKPFEYAQTEIKDMLLNLKKVSFMRDIKADLYKNAITGNKITYFYLK